MVTKSVVDKSPVASPVHKNGMHDPPPYLMPVVFVNYIFGVFFLWWQGKKVYFKRTECDPCDS